MHMTATYLDFGWDATHACLFSDLHIGSESCNLGQLRADLKAASELPGAQILINGDLGEAVSYTDPRFRGKTGLANLLVAMDAQVDQICDELVPYADQIVMVGRGNHETSAARHAHTDIVGRVIERINTAKSEDAPRCIDGGYTGFVRLCWDDGNKHTTSKVLYFHHGVGGGAPVTRGMIDFNRLAVSAWADIYWIGHKHTDIDSHTRVKYWDERLAQPAVKNVLAVITPGYNSDVKVADFDHAGRRYYESDYSTERYYQAQSQGYRTIRFVPRRVRAGGQDVVKVSMEVTKTIDD